MKEKIDISAQVKTMDMYDFLMYHAYASFIGITGVMISLAALFMFFVNIAGGFKTEYIILLFAGLLFTVINPLQLLMKAKQQILLNPVYKKPFQYTFDQEGIKISQEEIENSITWEDVIKAVSTPKTILIYTSKVNAFILPKRSFNDTYHIFLQLLKSKLSKKAMRIKIKQL